MKVVYVTGCLGFIGSYVTRACLAKGWHVRGVDKGTYAANEDLLLEFPARIEKLITLGIMNHDCYPNKFLLDLRAAAVSQLYQAGLSRSQLSISSLCTYSNQILFNSWRREKVKNRQWSMIATFN